MIDNLKSQMRKGMLEYCILLVLKKKTMYTTETDCCGRNRISDSVTHEEQRTSRLLLAGIHQWTATQILSNHANRRIAARRPGLRVAESNRHH